jgi:hypothetical protein
MRITDYSLNQSAPLGVTSLLLVVFPVCAQQQSQLPQGKVESELSEIRTENGVVREQLADSKSSTVAVLVDHRVAASS